MTHFLKGFDSYHSGPHACNGYCHGINIGSASTILLSSGDDEKLHIKLSSETLENLDSMFKIKLDVKKNKLDVICINKNKLSRYETEGSLTVEIVLPNKYSEGCEVAGSVKLLTIKNLHLNRLEYERRKRGRVRKCF